ncbi:hypothetical protein M427DRAFT_73135 [Gonapodya prolifera JEL478]|uniref:F-box domain-containing protein n=1 Tax=Gonapodya prolifera (strain JEL478) TaxID=1344416 RepID=A0A139A322_GONPJ|nr:hypothetical protein M427DRAFT_73135 [Gonapodya prolifera JEL478]|eukprot:KXS11161.1 hypothetical protein M427DRAFT_73135 [Gonapodya prolifera JEL478]
MSTSLLALLRRLYTAITSTTHAQKVPGEQADSIQSRKERLNARRTRSKAGNAPPEVLCTIMMHLERKDLMSATLVCLEWSNSARRKVWATLDLVRIPLRHRQMLNRISDETHHSSRLQPWSAFAITTILSEWFGGWRFDTSKELGLPTTVRKVVLKKTIDFNQGCGVDDNFFSVLGSFSRLTELEMFWPRSDTSLAPRSGAYPDPLSRMAEMQHLKRLTIIVHRGLSEGAVWVDSGYRVQYQHVGFKDIRNSPLCRGVEHLTIKENKIDFDALPPLRERRQTEHDRKIIFSGLLSQFGNLRSLTCGDVRSQSPYMWIKWTSDTIPFIREFLEKMNWSRLEHLSFPVDFTSGVRDLARELYIQIASQCNSLRSLSLYTYSYDSTDGGEFSDPALITFLTSLPALEELHLRPTASRWHPEREFPAGQSDLEHIFTRHNTMRVFSFGSGAVFDGTTLAALARLCPNLTSLEVSTINQNRTLTATDVTNAVARLPRLQELKLSKLESRWGPLEMAHANLLVAHPRLKTFEYSPGYYVSVEDDVEEVLFRRFGLK